MPSTRLPLVALLALSLAVNASVDRLCLDACQCRLTLSQSTALLNATCAVDSEFPSIHDVNTSLVLLRLGDGDPLKELDAFRCENCQLDGINLDDFEGVADIDPDILADGVLVKLPTEELESPRGSVLQLMRSDVGDCDAFLREFGGLRPTVKVGCTDADLDAEADAHTNADDATTDADDALPRARLLQDDAETSPSETDASPTEESNTNSEARQRNEDLVTEDTDEVTVKPRVDGVQPLVPVIPDEDPATVFAPWTIAVIVGIGAIIVAVAGYYIWQKWTEIRSCCCCGGEYQRP